MPRCSRCSPLGENGGAAARCVPLQWLLPASAPTSAAPTATTNTSLMRDMRPLPIVTAARRPEARGRPNPGRLILPRRVNSLSRRLRDLDDDVAPVRGRMHVGDDRAPGLIAVVAAVGERHVAAEGRSRSEEHTSEL